MKEYEQPDWNKLKEHLGKFILEAIGFAICVGFGLGIFVVILKMLF